MASSGRQYLRSPMRRRRQATWDGLRIPDCASPGRDSDTVRFQFQPDRSLYLHIALDQCGGLQQSYLAAELNWTVPDMAAKTSAAPSRRRGDCLSDTERHSLHRRPACVGDPVASVRPSERSARRMFDVLVHLSGGGKTQCRVEATVAAVGQLNGATMQRGEITDDRKAESAARLGFVKTFSGRESAA